MLLNKILTYSLVVLGCVSFYYYSTATISNLESKNKTYELSNKSIEDQVDTIEDAKKRSEIVAKELYDLSRTLNNQERILTNNLDRMDRLAKEKPRLIENIINRASRDRARCLEIASGDPVVYNLDKSNKVCPEIIKASK